MKYGHSIAIFGTLHRQGFRTVPTRAVVRYQGLWAIVRRVKELEFAGENGRPPRQKPKSQEAEEEAMAAAVTLAYQQICQNTTFLHLYHRSGFSPLIKPRSASFGIFDSQGLSSSPHCVVVVEERFAKHF